MYPGPYPQPYAYPPRAPFRDSRTLVRTAVLLWVLASIVALIGGLAQAQRSADQLARYKAGELPASSLSATYRFGILGGGATLLTAIFSIGGLVMVIVATFRLAKNHQALGRPGTRWTPGWAIAGWLIPLANSVIPYLQIRELWRGSDPELGPDAYGWTHRRAHRATWVALALALTAVALGVVLAIWIISSSFDSFSTLGNRNQFRVDLAQATADARPLQAVAGGISLVGTGLLAWLLLQVSQRQQVLAERFQLAGPSAAAPYASAPYGPGMQAPGIPPVAATFPPGWFADPWGRFQLRWWDGTRWTAHVSTGGGTAYDPLNDIPPAPPS